jgi:hypothetical protein
MVQPKVLAGGAAGAASVVIIYIASLFGLEVPGEVGAALAALISFAGAYIKA